MRFVWNSARTTFGIQPPTSFSNMFGSWLNGVGLKLQNQILLGDLALSWALWLYRNDVVFNKDKSNIYL